MLRIHLLGRPRLFSESPVVVSGRPKVLPLLSYLLLKRDAAVSRAQIASALWPDELERDARANLRRHLHYLGEYLPLPGLQPWILAKGATLQWNPQGAYWLDVAEFKRCAAQPLLYAQAVEIYDGDLLTTLDEEWLSEPRNELARAYERCLSELISACKARRDFEAAIGYAVQLLEHDPWREDVLRQLMVLRADLGDKAGALRDFDRFAAALRSELDVAPMPETLAVQRAIQQDIAPPGSLRTQRAPQRISSESLQPAVPFVAREAELARLHAQWLQAAHGAGATALIAGEAGIGKTRLANELGVACEAQGAMVLFGSTGSPEAVPYEAFLPIVRGALAFPSSQTLGSLWLSALNAIVPGTSQQTAPPLSEDAERQRLFESIALLLESVSNRRACILVIEDLHWAGSATLALLRYLSARLRKSAVLLVATYREDEAASHARLRDLRSDLERAGRLTHVALGRLGIGDVQKLVGNAADAQDLYARSGGNPFFLLELMHSQNAGEPLSAMILKRLEGITDESRTLVHLAAVAGPAFSIDLLTATTGWPEARVLDGIDDLIEAHIVAEHPSHAWLDYAFSHQLVQAAVYDSLQPTERIRRHRRIAKAIERLHHGNPRNASDAAFHYERSGEAHAAARNYLLAAHHAAALYASDEAYAYLTKVLELTDRPEDRVDALLLRERIAALRGNRDEQAAILEELRELELVRADGDTTCRVLRRTIDLANVTSSHDEERRLIAELRTRALEAGSEQWQLSALEAEAKLLRSTGDYAGAEACLRRMHTFSMLDDKNTFCDAHIAHADVLVYQGRLDEARPILNEVLAQIDSGTNRTALVRTLMAFSRAALAAQDYPAMSKYALQALDISSAIGDREGEALALHNIANGNVYTFHIEEARSAYDRAMELYEQLGNRVGIAGLLVDRGLFLTEIGLLDEAMAHYEQAASLADEIDFPWVHCVAMINASYCERLRANFQQAMEYASRALATARELGSAGLESAALGTLGAAERELGEYAPAIEHLKRGVEIRRPAGATPRLGDNLCALALAELLAGDLDHARDAAAELVELYQSNPRLAPQPSEWLSTAAQVYRACGQTSRADSLLDQAASIVAARAQAIEDVQTRAAFLALPFNRATASPQKLS